MSSFKDITVKQNPIFTIIISCILLYGLVLSSCAESTSLAPSPAPTLSQTPQPTSKNTPSATTSIITTPTLNHRTVILTPDDVFSLPGLIEWSTPDSGDLCEHLPQSQIIANPNGLSLLSGRFVLCIYERSFTAIDLDRGSLVSTDDESGDIVMFAARSWTDENPSYGISSRNKAYLENAYVINTYANHSGANNLSYDYCENKLRGQTDLGGMRVEVGGIACVKTTEGQVALLRVEKIYPAVTLSVEFSFAVLRNE
jgi:hypothetical protein